MYVATLLYPMYMVLDFYMIEPCGFSYFSIYMLVMQKD